MKNEFEEIEALIKEKLTEEETEVYENLDDKNIFEMFRGLFCDKNKWFILLLLIV